MKTTQLFTAVLALFLSTSIAFTSCTGKQAKSAEASDVETGAKVKAPGMDLNTAAFMGNLAAVQQHIKAGTNLNSKEPMGGSTPLIAACVFGKTEVAKALINAGADLTITNNDGATPLHVAAFFCDTAIVRALLDKGADKNALNGQGTTAFQTVSVPFSEIKPVYEFLGQQLSGFGLTLDFKHIEATRPVIAQMLQE